MAIIRDAVELSIIIIFAHQLKQSRRRGAERERERLLPFCPQNVGSLPIVVRESAAAFFSHSSPFPWSAAE